MRRIDTVSLSLAMLTALAASSAAAQDVPVGEASTDETEAEDQAPDGEILVTAQRRTERVQDIPVAISAFGGEQVQKLGIASIENVASRVPSFYFGSFGASRPQLYIRGIGTRSFDPGSESSVGVFVDDVYLGRSSGSFGALKDVQRIEVLRGPQGTLYGRNTIAGAINVITRGPTRDFSGDFEAGISNYGGYEATAAVGGPITDEGSLSFRVAGWRTFREGYAQNILTGTRFQGIDNWGGRARLRFEPTEAIRIDLTAETVRDGDESAFSGFNRGSGPILNRTTGVLTPANPRAVFLARPGVVPIIYTGGLTGANSSDPYLDRRADSYIGRIEIDLGFATLTSISAKRDLALDEGRDLDYSSIVSGDQRSIEDSSQFTQELRFTSDPAGAASFDGALDWIVGGFYYRDRSTRRDDFILGIESVVGLLTGAAQTSVSASTYETDSYALFGQATWHVTPRFDVTVGGRYTRDEKRAVQAGTNTRPGVPLVAVPFTVDNSATFESFDPRIVLSYELSDDANVYASYSTGFKSGGFQYVPFSVAQANVVFQPENITTYEAGIKAEWLDRTLTTNLAAYYYDYKNLQVSRIVDLGGGAAASLITNAASSTIKGIDLEIIARPSDTFNVSIAYGYLDAKYDQYIFNATTDFSGTRLVRAPEHSVNVGAEWNVPLGGNVGLTLRADYSLLDTFFHEPGEANPVFGGANSLTREPSYGLLDLRAALQFGRLRATAYMTNATDVSYRRSVLALGSTLSDFPGQPRIYGLKIGYSF